MSTDFASQPPGVSADLAGGAGGSLIRVRDDRRCRHDRRKREGDCQNCEDLLHGRLLSSAISSPCQNRPGGSVTPVTLWAFAVGWVAKRPHVRRQSRRCDQRGDGSTDHHSLHVVPPTTGKISWKNSYDNYHKFVPATADRMGDRKTGKRRAKTIEALPRFRHGGSPDRVNEVLTQRAGL
jgi:hypothetical protein